MHAHARKIHKRARARKNGYARVYSSSGRARAQIFTKKNLDITFYLMSKCFKFGKDPTFRWGDIPLFVTLYDLELELLSFSKTPKNALSLDQA